MIQNVGLFGDDSAVSMDAEAQNAFKEPISPKWKLGSKLNGHSFVWFVKSVLQSLQVIISQARGCTNRLNAPACTVPLT